MIRRLLGKVDDGRFGRALVGLQAGWQWECEERHAERVEGTVHYGSKQYMVVIARRGSRCAARCGCKDAVARGVLCKHIAFVAMAELAAAAAARTAHRQLQVLGR
ncbi:MAG: SWIM zinc finger family protein [Desulfotomaculaceae bacterium]